MEYQGETINTEVQISIQASLGMAQRKFNTFPWLLLPVNKGNNWSFHTKKTANLLQHPTMKGSQIYFPIWELWLAREFFGAFGYGTFHLPLEMMQFAVKLWSFHPDLWGTWSNLTKKNRMGWLKPASRKGWTWHQNTHLWPERQRDDGWFDFDTQVLQL